MTFDPCSYKTKVCTSTHNDLIVRLKVNLGDVQKTYGLDCIYK